VSVGKADESTRKYTNPHVLVCLTTKNGAIGSSQMAVRSRQMKKQDKKRKKKRFIDNMTDLLLWKKEKKGPTREKMDKQESLEEHQTGDLKRQKTARS
jgi:hypothetical protein